MRRLPLVALLLAAAVPAARPARAAADLRLVVEPRDGVAPLVAFIRAATRTLDGEVYLASSREVLRALEDAAGRHVAVRIDLERHPYGTGSAAPALAYRRLAAHGVQVRWTGPVFAYTHAKYLVRDGAAAWVGTMNWTVSAFAGNREFALIDTNPTAVRESEAIFAADWDRRAYAGPADALGPAALLDRRAASTRDRGHGRQEEVGRLVASTDLAASLDWPGLAQVFRLERTWREHGTAKQALLYGITSLSPADGPPERLLALKRGTPARGYPAIENGLHRVKDVTLGEDQSTLHMGQGPTVMAFLRDAAVSLLRRAGIRQIAARLREHAQDPAPALALVLAAPTHA